MGNDVDRENESYPMYTCHLCLLLLYSVFVLSVSVCTLSLSVCVWSCLFGLVHFSGCINVFSVVVLFYARSYAPRPSPFRCLKLFGSTRAF